ncbi:hypothetical protein AV530_013292 [Patagioenas fasciata monilis]|uniref:Uncharacterized protein n=1 Tax=Patagioenas fasciata monilis TaxID=372326 RepID=A0A1V4JNX5_PATFA|nr:hypothetical protein AV530_013292 [Patagioenas fasciata monilis]
MVWSVSASCSFGTRTQAAVYNLELTSKCPFYFLTKFCYLHQTCKDDLQKDGEGTDAVTKEQSKKYQAEESESGKARDFKTITSITRMQTEN